MDDVREIMSANPRRWVTDHQYLPATEIIDVATPPAERVHSRGNLRYAVHRCRSCIPL